MKKQIAQTRENIPTFPEVTIKEIEAGRWQIVTSRLESPLGPRLLKSVDEDFPDKPHKDIDDLEEAVKLAKFWNDWIARQNGGPKKAKK